MTRLSRDEIERNGRCIKGGGGCFLYAQYRGGDVFPDGHISRAFWTNYAYLRRSKYTVRRDTHQRGRKKAFL